MNEVRFGLIGLGNIGRLHAGNLRSGKIPRARLTAVADLSSQALAAYSDLETYTEPAALLKSKAIDAVIIATPHFQHTSLGIEALGRGLHVMVEKPISVHKADAERLLAAHKSKKQVFAAMFNNRLDPHFLKIKQLIDSGELGEIRRTQWVITDWFRPEIYYASGGWRGTWKGEGGGLLVNQCPHNLDLFQWLCGMPKRVQAFCHFGKHHDIEVEDEVTAYFEYPNGATGVFVSTTGEAPGTCRLEIAGERGKIVLEGGKISFTRNVTPTSEFSRTTKNVFGKPDVWNIEIPAEGTGPQHVGILNNFVEAILDGATLVSPAAEGIHSVELANAMLHSSLTGKMLELPLDGKAFERQLKKLMAGSKTKKTVVEVGTGQVDLSKSFSGV
jgi:predicted dehydrogenase